MYFLLDTVTPMQLVYLFLLTETSDQESLLLMLFHFNKHDAFHRIARIVIYSYVKEGWGGGRWVEFDFD